MEWRIGVHSGRIFTDICLVDESSGPMAPRIPLNVLKGEPRSAEHLTRHPFGKVPVLDHDGLRLIETAAIARCLNDVLTGKSLIPPTKTPRSASTASPISGRGCRRSQALRTPSRSWAESARVRPSAGLVPAAITPLQIMLLGRAIPCSAVAQQRHKIIRNRVALVCEESVCVVTGGTTPAQSGVPTHAHLHHWQRRNHPMPRAAVRSE
jgi:hypothetical protein